MAIIPSNIQDAEPILRSAGFSHAWLYGQDEDSNEFVFMVDQRLPSPDEKEQLILQLMQRFPGKVWLLEKKAGVASIQIF